MIIYDYLSLSIFQPGKRHAQYIMHFFSLSEFTVNRASHKMSQNAEVIASLLALT